MYWALGAYLVGINLTTLLFFVIDKLRAIRGRWRIRESVLLGMSFLGGAAGGLLAMLLCRHKIRKPRFFVGVPMMMLLHLVLLMTMNGVKL